MSAAETTTLDSRVSRILGRAARYKFLATAFASPEPSALAWLTPGHWPDVGQDPEALCDALSRFKVACAEADLSALQDEYLVLFARQVRCSPYESSYGDGRRLGGKPAELADISGFYAAFGMEPSRSHPELPDHIAAELEFMSVLCLKEAYALFHGLVEQEEVTREAQRSFLAAHLGRWVGAFAEGVEAAAGNAFFPAAAVLLREFVSGECGALGATPSPAGGTTAPETVDDIACPFASACGEPWEERPPRA